MEQATITINNKEYILTDSLLQLEYNVLMALFALVANPRPVSPSSSPRRNTVNIPAISEIYDYFVTELEFTNISFKLVKYAIERLVEANILVELSLESPTVFAVMMPKYALSKDYSKKLTSLDEWWVGLEEAKDWHNKMRDQRMPPTWVEEKIGTTELQKELKARQQAADETLPSHVIESILEGDVLLTPLLESKWGGLYKTTANDKRLTEKSDTETCGLADVYMRRPIDYFRHARKDSDNGGDRFSVKLAAQIMYAMLMLNCVPQGQRFLDAVYNVDASRIREFSGIDYFAAHKLLEETLDEVKAGDKAEKCELIIREILLHEINPNVWPFLSKYRDYYPQLTALFAEELTKHVEQGREQRAVAFFAEEAKHTDRKKQPSLVPEGVIPDTSVAQVPHIEERQQTSRSIAEERSLVFVDNTRFAGDSFIPVPNNDYIRSLIVNIQKAQGTPEQQEKIGWLLYILRSNVSLQDPNQASNLWATKLLRCLTDEGMIASLDRASNNRTRVLSVIGERILQFYDEMEKQSSVAMDDVATEVEKVREGINSAEIMDRLVAGLSFQDTLGRSSSSRAESVIVEIEAPDDEGAPEQIVELTDQIPAPSQRSESVNNETIRDLIDKLGSTNTPIDVRENIRLLIKQLQTIKLLAVNSDSNADFCLRSKLLVSLSQNGLLDRWERGLNEQLLDANGILALKAHILFLYSEISRTHSYPICSQTKDKSHQEEIEDSSVKVAAVAAEGPTSETEKTSTSELYLALEWVSGKNKQKRSRKEREAESESESEEKGKRRRTKTHGSVLEAATTPELSSSLQWMSQRNKRKCRKTKTYDSVLEAVTPSPDEAQAKEKEEKGNKKSCCVCHVVE